MRPLLHFMYSYYSVIINYLGIYLRPTLAGGVVTLAILFETRARLCVLVWLSYERNTVTDDQLYVCKVFSACRAPWNHPLPLSLSLIARHHRSSSDSKMSKSRLLQSIHPSIPSKKLPLFTFFRFFTIVKQRTKNWIVSSSSFITSIFSKKQKRL